MQTLMQFLHAYLLVGVFAYGISVLIYYVRKPYSKFNNDNIGEVVFGVVVWPLVLVYAFRG